MKAMGWFADLYDEIKDRLDFKLRVLEIEVTEKILQAMKRNHVSRSDLAIKIGTSKAAVSKLLNDGSNLTLKRLLKISDAVGCSVKIELIPSHASVYEMRVQPPRQRDTEFHWKLTGIPDSYTYQVGDSNHVDAA